MLNDHYEGALAKVMNNHYEANLATYRCPTCGEWFTEYEMAEKAAKDEYYCRNCGSQDFVKCVGEFESKECFSCEFNTCPY
jgi:DNA-directed RNA polymerase subunit RPC12/RpoP